MNRIEQEKRTVKLMIELYCRKVEKNPHLCSECRELIEFSHKKLDRCKYGEGKTSCKKCSTHCYPPGKREKIRLIMRTMGPKMILYSPVDAIRHLIHEIK